MPAFVAIARINLDTVTGSPSLAVNSIEMARRRSILVILTVLMTALAVRSMHHDGVTRTLSAGSSSLSTKQSRSLHSTPPTGLLGTFELDKADLSPLNRSGSSHFTPPNGLIGTFALDISSSYPVHSTGKARFTPPVGILGTFELEPSLSLTKYPKKASSTPPVGLLGVFTLSSPPRSLTSNEVGRQLGSLPSKTSGTGNGLAFVVVTTKPPSQTQSNSFETLTISGVSGKPGGFSQTSTTDLNGLATILPVWFGANGAAVIVVLTAGSLRNTPPPPPPGFPPLEIGPDGEASPEDPTEDPKSEDPDDPEDPKDPEDGGHHSTAHDMPGNVQTTSKGLPLPKMTSYLQVLSASLPILLQSSSGPTQVSSSRAALTSSAVALNNSMIFPKNREDGSNAALTSDLQTLFGDRLYIAQNPFTGLVYWSAPLTAGQIAKYQSDPRVSNEPCHPSRKCRQLIDSGVGNTSRYTKSNYRSFGSNQQCDTRDQA